MNLIIIIAAVVLIVILLVVRSKQQKEGGAKRRSAAREKRLEAEKAAQKAQEEAKQQHTAAAKTSAHEPPKDEVWFKQTLAKIDDELAKKAYTRAEGLINTVLNHDNTQQDLYFKLLDIYHVQNDEFAIQQLFSTVQRLKFNELYQRLYSQHDQYIREQQAQLQAKQAEIIESVQPTVEVKEAPVPAAVESKPSDTANVSFDQLAEDIASTLSTTLDSDKTATTAGTATAADNDLLDFVSTKSVASTDNQADTLDFTLSSDSATADVEVKEPSLTEPTPEQTPIPEEEDNFRFTSNPAYEQASEEAAGFKGFSFTTEEPTKEAEETPSFSFTEATVEETPATEESALPSDVGLSMQDVAVEETPQKPSLADIDTSGLGLAEPEPEPAQCYADQNDPLVQTFPHLAEVDPVEMDIELAEHYVRLGAFQSAKFLIDNQLNSLTNEQSQRVEQLRQKIA